MRNAVRPCYTSANGPHLRRLGQQLPWDLDPDWKGSSVFQHVWQGLDGHPYSLISMQAEDVLARPTRSAIPTREHPAARGFTLVEVLVSVAIAGITLAALYSGFASCLLIERHTEESTRAVAILREQLELVRLYPWSQVTNSAYINGPFTNYMYQSANGSGTGTRFTGVVVVTNGPSGFNYSDRMRFAVISVTWTSGGVPHTRQMRTIVSDHGLVTMR